MSAFGGKADIHAISVEYSRAVQREPIECGRDGTSATVVRSPELFGVFGTHQSYHLPGQFTPGAYGSSRRLIGELELAELPDSAARDCDFTEFFVSAVRLAAMPGPEAASNNPAAIATM
jgi:hypothetical protein